MGTPAASGTTADAAERRAASQTSPVGVVWCRQVDNEAESPGYTTVPEEFPGHRETLETIRIVGNLTVNVADTHDYWDPDPSQPLSYYPNLFLYPAANGRYTCIGRMFLSTEDRPRLGMKTLVLDTQQLLATGEFGATVLRWHASMGGPRREGSRPPPTPDPALYGIVAEGFLFHRGSTDPVLLVASDQWEMAMQAILDLVRVLPAPLTALGAVLAFPYFLPQPKTNLHELTEQIPLTLALMRVARGEAAGDRHAKRIQNWESASMTVRDLTDGIPAASSKAKESTPLIVQFIRDRQEAKLVPIRQRVDLAESARLRAHLADPERQGGRDRRKEIWRIGTAMESAALLLQRARGRHVPVTAETAKRAQEYLQARPPSAMGEAPVEDAVVAPVGVTAEPVPAGRQLPPWLNRPGDSAPAPANARSEFVPVSVSDDPTLHPAAAAPPPYPPPGGLGRSPPTANPSAPAARLPPSPETPAGEATLVPERPPAAPVVAPTPPPPPVVINTGPTQPEIERMIQERVGQSRAQIAEEVRRATADLEQRLTTHWSEAAGRRGEADDTFRLGLEKRLSEAQAAQQTSVETLQLELDRRLEASEVRLHAALATAIGPEVDQRLAASLDTRVVEAVSKLRDDQRGVVEAHRQKVADEADRTNAELRQRIAAAEEELRANLSAQLDLHLREAADREISVREELEGRLRESIQKRLDEIEAKRIRDQKDADQKLTILVDGRTRELSDRLQKGSTDQLGRLGGTVDERVRAAEANLSRKLDARASEVQASNLQAIADLQVRMQGHFDERLREGLDREREKYLELLARLKAEVEGTFARASDPAKLDPLIRERMARTIDAFRLETQRMVDARVGEAEAKLSDVPQDGLRRLEQVEQVLAERESLLEQLETRIRGELEELDHRTQVLSDRLVPVVRKAWLKIAEMQKTPAAGAPPSDGEVQQMRRDLHREVRRLEAELSEKTGEIRDRMETSIANQGRVWLTLVRQLSQLTDDRRALERSKSDRGGSSSWSEGGNEADPFAGLDSPPPRASGRSANAPSSPPPSLGPDPLGDVDPPADRRRPTRRR
jgi:hypothetical protein